jgi:hypothetical protein
MRLDGRNINSPENEIKGKLEYRRRTAAGESFGRAARVGPIYKSATHFHQNWKIFILM